MRVAVNKLLTTCFAAYVLVLVYLMLTVCEHTPCPHCSHTVMHNVTFFSLVSSNSSFYYMQTLLLLRSFRQFVPGTLLHLLVTDDVDPAIVRQLGDLAVTHVVSSYPGEPTRPHPNDTHISKLHDSWVHQLSKVKLWSMNMSDVVCYLDSDVVFFGSSALQGVVSECLDGFRGSDSIEWCGFDNEDPNGNDTHWEMNTIQANFFCLRPDASLFAKMERELVYPFTHGQLLYKGKYVATEQDMLNLFFNGKIHYVKKKRLDGGKFHHSDWNFMRWVFWDLGLRSLTGC